MRRRLVAAAVVLAVTGLAVGAVAGQYPGEGPVVLTLTSTHGVHLGDLAIAALWVLVVVLVARLARPPGRSEERRRGG